MREASIETLSADATLEAALISDERREHDAEACRPIGAIASPRWPGLL